MIDNELTTEQSILQAAEQEFLDKGYALSKTTNIAKAAGVNHAMLHYYFRTKENLFNMVFQKKVTTLAGSFANIFEHDLPFFEKLKLGIETHFDVIAENPKLPFFIFNEILTNDERKKTFFRMLMPSAAGILRKLSAAIEEEVAKGTIHPVQPIDLLLNIVSLNVFIFAASPLIAELSGNNEEQYQAFLQQRKKNNVELVLNQLMIKK